MKEDIRVGRVKRLVLSLACIVATGLSIAPCSAQSGASTWSAPLNLFETRGRASEAEVVADPSGAVHVFWAYAAPEGEDSGDSQAIYYARFQEGAWLQPVDVLISPGGRVARMQAAVADGQGYLHMVWSGGNAIFYSRAYGPEAGSPWGWSKPEGWLRGANALEPAIAADRAGGLYVIWTEGYRGLVFTRSADGGGSWTDPSTIFEADGQNELPRWGRIAVDDAGRLHVVLTHTDRAPAGAVERDDPNYLYYLSSDDGGQSWSAPLLLTPEVNFGEVNVARYGESVVHVVWNGRAGRNGRYHRWSQDGGQTWSDVIEVLAPAPQDPIGMGGLTGFPAMVTDATGALHLVSATGGGDYYFRWADGVWSTPVLISPGLDGGGLTQTSNSLEQPSLAISEGNRLHAVFHDGFERIWYTTTVIEAPYEAARALATVTATDVWTEELTATPPPLGPAPAATGPALDVDGMEQESTTDSLLPAVAGVLAAAVLVLVVVALRLPRLRQ